MSEMGGEVRWQDEKSGQHGLILKRTVQVEVKVRLTVKVKMKDKWHCGVATGEVLPVSLQPEQETESCID